MRFNKFFRELSDLPSYIALMVPLCEIKWPPYLTKEISLNDISFFTTAPNSKIYTELFPIMPSTKVVHMDL